MNKKYKRPDKLVARLTADRVLKGTASKNQVEHLRSLIQSLDVKRDETLEEKDDSAEEGKGLLQTLKESNGGEYPAIDLTHEINKSIDKFHTDSLESKQIKD